MPARKPTETSIDGRVGRRLADLRKQRGMSQAELARKLGVPQQYVSAYERGRLRMYARHIIKVARALQISADDLLGLRRTSSPPRALSPRWRKLIEQVDGLSRSDRQTLFRTVSAFLSGAWL
jgi:transcriptional regulator with XRE-family HTH domain